jgi:hypothetical protein
VSLINRSAKKHPPALGGSKGTVDVWQMTFKLACV